MTDQTHEHVANHDAPRPYWVPTGVDFDRLPDELRAAIVGIVNPAYRELVLASRDELEKASGVTIISLLWLELLDQVQMGRDLTDPGTIFSPSKERENLIARHLRLSNAKIKASGFLLRLHEFREKYGHVLGESSECADTIQLPARPPADAQGV
jgi:hypothetical protein